MSPIDVINTLLVGAGDLRQVMKTIAGGNYCQYGQPLHVSLMIILYGTTELLQIMIT